MSNDIKLGTKPYDGQLRDAIHIAIIPMIAGSGLKPGAHVGLFPDGTAGMSPKPIGIVDPFIGGNVYKGERFWLLLYQQSVTGMRHEWQHPSFPSSESAPKPEPVDDKKSVSEMWLKVYVRKHCPYDEDQSDGGYSQFLKNVTEQRWIYYHGSDCHNIGDVEDAEELFHHLSVVLDRRIDASYFEAFTCSC